MDTTGFEYEIKRIVEAQSWLLGWRTVIDENRGIVKIFDSEQQELYAWDIADQDVLKSRWYAMCFGEENVKRGRNCVAPF
jgi:hypothetical protein